MNKTYYVKTEEKEHTVKIQNKDEKFYGYDAELVENPTGTLVEKTITENGEYLPASDNADGYSKVTVDVQSGGQQPTLFAPIITTGANTVSWANDTRNGSFAVTLSATADGVAVTSPLTVTEEMYGKTLIVTASAENFKNATSTMILHSSGLIGRKWQMNATVSFGSVPLRSYLCNGVAHEGENNYSFVNINFNKDYQDFISFQPADTNHFYTVFFYPAYGWYKRVGQGERIIIDAPIIEITGGSDASSTDLENWFEENGTEILS